MQIQRTGWMGECVRFGRAEELSAVFNLISAGHLKDAVGMEADFVAFHCHQCDQSYCDTCWSIGPLEFDEGFYDCTRGRCPTGHEQIVDD